MDLKNNDILKINNIIFLIVLIVSLFNYKITISYSLGYISFLINYYLLIQIIKFIIDTKINNKFYIILLHILNKLIIVFPLMIILIYFKNYYYIIFLLAIFQYKLVLYFKNLLIK